MDLSKILKFETIVLCPLFGPKEKKMKEVHLFLESTIAILFLRH